MEDEIKRHFLFSMTDEDGDEYTFEETIGDYVFEMQDELDYLLDQFKRFLKAAGWNEQLVSRLQYLEDDEWKYVLTQYGDWSDDYEKTYQLRKGVSDV